MPFIKRSEIKIVSMIEDEELDEKTKALVKKMSSDQETSSQKKEKPETNKSGS